MKLLLMCVLGCGSLVAADRPALGVKVMRDAKHVGHVTVLYQPQADDRHMYVMATSENIFESSYRQLEGLESHPPYRFSMKLPDDGTYEVTAEVRDGAGRLRQSARAALITMPPPQ